MSAPVNTGKGLVPPHSLEAEKSLIGACLLDADAMADAVAMLGPDDFYLGRHRVIFAAMRELFDASEPVDLVTVTNRLNLGGSMDKAGGITYLASLTDDVIFVSRARSWARIVRDHAVRRRMIACGQRMVELCFRDDLPIDEIMSDVEAEMFAAADGRGEKTAFSMAEVAAQVMDAVRIRQSQTGVVTGIATGFTEFDGRTTGLHGGELIVIAARPSMGKTALAVNIAVRAAREQDTPVVIYSLEMARNLLGERILSDLGTIHSAGIRNGSLSPSDFERMLETAAASSNIPLYIDDTPNMSIIDLRIRARRMHAKHKIGLMIVDYMQLMHGNDRKKREQQVAEISRGLKSIARELDIPVIALSQLNRGVETRADKRPMLSDLRESGAIEQDADLIVFLYRADYYRKAGQRKDNLATVIIAKQRNGPTGEFQLMFQGEYSRFSQLTDDDRHDTGHTGHDGGMPWMQQ